MRATPGRTVNCTASWAAWIASARWRAPSAISPAATRSWPSSLERVGEPQRGAELARDPEHLLVAGAGPARRRRSSGGRARAPTSAAAVHSRWPSSRAIASAVSPSAKARPHSPYGSTSSPPAAWAYASCRPGADRPRGLERSQDARFALGAPAAVEERPGQVREAGGLGLPVARRGQAGEGLPRVRDGRVELPRDHERHGERVEGASLSAHVPGLPEEGEGAGQLAPAGRHARQVELHEPDAAGVPRRRRAARRACRPPARRPRPPRGSATGPARSPCGRPTGPPRRAEDPRLGERARRLLRRARARSRSRPGRARSPRGPRGRPRGPRGAGAASPPGAPPRSAAVMAWS